MTGILPIAKYSSGSPLNMFYEYTMANTELARFGTCFGFTGQEVETLYERYYRKNPDTAFRLEDLREWYNGYQTAGNEAVYNPRSVNCALSENHLGAYWSSTGPYDEILSLAHDTEIPILNYNNEADLGALVNLVYLAARDRYRIEREDRAGRGYADFIFYPLRVADTGLILELKVDAAPEDAIVQMKEKKYALGLKEYLQARGGSGKILAVALTYSRRTKEHFCKVEEIKY